LTVKADNKLLFPAEFINQVIEGDCLDILSGLPDRSVDVILTDPPWPGTDVSFSPDPVKLFADFAVHAARLTTRLIVVLGCDTDIRFLSSVPCSLPFFRVCWLRRIPCRYRGSLMYGSDVVYVFGHRKTNGTNKVMGGESTAVLQRDHDDENPHPTRRHIEHMSWLVRFFSRPRQLILDPFCGSGTTLVAAKRANRLYCGIDIEKQFVEYSRLRLSREKTLWDGQGRPESDGLEAAEIKI
jgi:site-specific DNA-methyltransferase (adenine-specific)